MSSASLGFIGLGIMGGAMARNLLAAGHGLTVHNRSARRQAELEQAGARSVESAARVAELADIIFVSVSDDRALEEVVDGERGILRCAGGRGKLVVDFSTVAPSTARKVGARLATREIAFIDAPVSGGDVGARNATLTVMAGGAPEDLERARPYLEKIAGRIVHTGGCGTGQMTKCVNQVIVALNVAAMTEGLVLAKSCGLNLQTTLDIVSSGAAGSWSLSNYGPRVLKGDMAPGFRAEHMLKDLEITLAEAAERKAQLPVAELVKNLYLALCAAQDAAASPAPLGNHALLKLYEQLGGWSK